MTTKNKTIEKRIEEIFTSANVLANMKAFEFCVAELLENRSMDNDANTLCETALNSFNAVTCYYNCENGNTAENADEISEWIRVNARKYNEISERYSKSKGGVEELIHSMTGVANYLIAAIELLKKHADEYFNNDFDVLRDCLNKTAEMKIPVMNLWNSLGNLKNQNYIISASVAIKELLNSGDE